MKIEHKYTTRLLLILFAILALILSTIVYFADAMEMRPQDNINMTGHNVTYIRCLRFNDGTYQCTEAVNFTKMNDTIREWTASVTYNASSINATSGTWTGGNLQSIRVPEDGDTFNVTEAAGANPLIVVVNWTNVRTIDSIIGRIYYDGGTGHEIQVELWRYDTKVWENYIEFTGSNDFVNFYIPVFDPQYHVNGTNVSLRLNHIQSGIPTHHLYIDYLVLIEGWTTLTVAEHDSLGGRDNESNHPWAMPYSIGARNITALQANITDLKTGAIANLTGNVSAIYSNLSVLSNNVTKAVNDINAARTFDACPAGQYVNGSNYTDIGCGTPAAGTVGLDADIQAGGTYWDLNTSKAGLNITDDVRIAYNSSSHITIRHTGDDSIFNTTGTLLARQRNYVNYVYEVYTNIGNRNVYPFFKFQYGGLASDDAWFLLGGSRWTVDGLVYFRQLYDNDTGNIQFTTVGDGAALFDTFDNVVGPVTNKEEDLGTAAISWDDCYCDDYVTTSRGWLASSTQAGYGVIKAVDVVRRLRTLPDGEIDHATVDVSLRNNGQEGTLSLNALSTATARAIDEIADIAEDKGYCVSDEQQLISRVGELEANLSAAEARVNDLETTQQDMIKVLVGAGFVGLGSLLYRKLR